MKRTTLLMCLIIILSILSCACHQVDIGEDDQPSTHPITDVTNPTPSVADPITEPPVTEPPTTEPVTTDPSGTGVLPEYVPGSLELDPRWSSEFPFDRKYRYLFYSLPGTFTDLLTPEQYEDFENFLEDYTNEHEFGKTQEEMALVIMIKRYDIPKEEFDKAVAKYASIKGTVRHESDEVPNSDILYTFDNEIINHYYRYE